MEYISWFMVLHDHGSYQGSVTAGARNSADSAGDGAHEGSWGSDG